MTAFLAVNDDVARRGMRMLAAPFKGDPQVVSGESGAATFGALATIMKDESYRELRLELGLNQDSKVLMFSPRETRIRTAIRPLYGKRTEVNKCWR